MGGGGGGGGGGVAIVRTFPRTFQAEGLIRM